MAGMFGRKDACMTKILLVRHGKTQWNAGGRFQGHADVALSEEGLQQADLLAARFPAEKLDAVYASDLSRAYCTAQCVAVRFGLTATPIAALREIHFGAWEGLTYEEIEARWPEQLRLVFERPDLAGAPDGETFRQLRRRAWAALTEIHRRHPNQTVALFAHGGTNRALLTKALHMPLRYFWTIQQENTAVNIFRCDAQGGLWVERVNDASHLRAL